MSGRRYEQEVVSRVYLDTNVYDAALQRIEWVFSEFEHVYADISGGKDSTVIYSLALQVAEKLGRLPLDVLFIDQEAEWATVIDYIRELMHGPRVRPHWLQCPIRIFNATSHRTQWLMCWEAGAEWMREKEPDSVHDNTFGTMTFRELYGAFLRSRHPTESAAHLGGVRCEESPGRRLGLTTYETYKGETWGKIEDRTRQHYTWYPIYDWSYLDVWTAIHRNQRLALLPDLRPHVPARRAGARDAGLQHPPRDRGQDAVLPAGDRGGHLGPGHSPPGRPQHRRPAARAVPLPGPDPAGACRLAGVP